MLKKITACVCTLAVAAACLPLAACAKKRNVQVKSYYSMGTEAVYLVVSETDNETFGELAASVGDFLASTERSVSASVPQSCVSAFNSAEAGATVELDRTGYEVFSLALKIYADTDGYFNPAVWYCEDAFGFVPHGAEEVKMPYAVDALSLPDEKYVTAFRDLAAHFGEVTLSEADGKYYATKPEFTVKAEGDDNEYSLRVDFGGIVKGWCTDRVSEMMDGFGIDYGYFNFGLSSMCLKEYAYNDTGDYSVSSGDPRRSGENYVSLPVKNVSLSTSGDGIKYYEIGGERYCHIIDPTTGAPIRTGVASVSVFGGTAAENDALTTALAAMGKDRAVEFINSALTDRKVVMLVFEDGTGKIITNCPEDFEIKNKNYTVANTVADGKIVFNRNVA